MRKYLTLASVSMFVPGVDVSTSGIPNAGNGAFLTFLGARHLKDEAFSRSPQKTLQKPLIIDDDLEAIGDQGFGIHVKLTGSSIDEHQASRPFGIGPNRAYSECDYEASPTTVFSSRGKGNGLVREFSFLATSVRLLLREISHRSVFLLADLGRYGPFRPIDRKPISHFEMKSFIVGYGTICCGSKRLNTVHLLKLLFVILEPSEWCFGVDEKLFGRDDCIIDITDDLTGHPHGVAVHNIPMHVNEVGHNKTLIQNVQSRTQHDRSVHVSTRTAKVSKPIRNFLPLFANQHACSFRLKVLHEY